MESRPRLLVIAGPTGVGKTATAVALASRLPIEVISADSRQVYRGMDVATGKPTAAERAAAVHHLIDIADPDDPYTAARFAADASAAISAIRARGRLPVVVGGTGLYVRALLRGLDPGVPADPAFRAAMAGLAAERGRAALHARLAAAAPAMARRLHPNDSVRVVRALELVRGGRPVGEERRRWRDAEAPFRLTYVALTMERGALDQRLRGRAAAMVAAGLEDEVRGLLRRGYAPELPAMQGIGYREFVAVVRGTMQREDALARMRRDTLRYARRQWTWFSREPDVTWIDVEAAGGVDGVAAVIEGRLERGGGIG